MKLPYETDAYNTPGTESEENTELENRENQPGYSEVRESLDRIEGDGKEQGKTLAVVLDRLDKAEKRHAEILENQRRIATAVESLGNGVAAIITTLTAPVVEEVKPRDSFDHLAAALFGKRS